MNLTRLRCALRKYWTAMAARRALVGAMVCIGLIAVGVGTSAAAGSASPAASVDRTLTRDSGPAVHHDKSPPLRSIPPKHTPGTAHPAKPIPPGPAGLSHTSAPNTSGRASAKLAPAVGTNFNGLTDSSPNTCNCAPPDNEVAVGAGQVVELVNSAFAVYNSSTGATVMSGRSTNTIWSGFGGGCQNNNDGDATVTYDAMAGRWVFQQFSVSTTPYLDCVAISTSSDATGTYNRYSFQYSNFPDYPKLGVWSDGYYLSFNQFQGNTFLGPEMCAFNRSAMLSGAPASQVCSTPTNYLGSLLPATVDGNTAPPSGEPEWFVGIDPNNANALAYFKFQVNWGPPASATVTDPTSLAVAAFSDACGGGVCIPQSGTKQLLDSLGDRLMWRFAYRNFGDHEALVVSHAVTSGSSVGMRWYELRTSGSSTCGTAGNSFLCVAQQGTYAGSPTDSNYRWMGSIAMDHVGDIGLGYSISSKSLHPGLRYTGRVPTDGTGTMEPETTLFTGAGSQTRTLNRWGDYSEMSVDPSDDCTFWYVNEYLPTNGTFNWHTYIGSFKFSGCSSSGSTPPAPTGVSATGGVGQVALSWSPSSGATSYKVFRSTSSGGESYTSPPLATPTGTPYIDTSVTAGTKYYYTVKATNSAGDSPASSEVSATTAPPAPTGLSATGSVGQVALSWSPSSGATSYKVFRSTSSGGESYTSPPLATPTGTSYTDTSGTAGTPYYYTVKASNSAGDSPASSEVSATPTSGTTYASTVLSTPGLVSYWRLNEASGITANDQKSTNPGTYAGGSTLNQAGLLANDSTARSVSLDGLTGYVTVPSAPSLNITGAFTYESWVEWSGSGGGTQGLMGKWDGSNGPLLLSHGPGTGHGINLQLFINSGVSPVVTGGSLDVGKSYHVVAVFDGTNASLYVNGALVGGPSPASAPTSSSTAFALGEYQAANFFFGNLEEAAVYNTALSAATIQNHYNVGAGL
jgi:hypothetical protein